MLDVTTRLANRADTAFLWQMLPFAASMSGTEESVAQAKADPDLRGYVEDFGREGDLGVIGLTGDTPVGAAWLRLLHGEPRPAKVWTRDVPELAIATRPEARGRGVGSRLLARIIDAATGLHPAILLSVREGNPAVHLYERHGFSPERRVVNRAGGVSLVMRRVLPA